MTARGWASLVARRLITLAVLNAVFTTWATVLDARRSSALMQALGARSGQVISGLVVAQVLSALPGAIVGIPLGLGNFKLIPVSLHPLGREIVPTGNRDAFAA